MKTIKICDISLRENGGSAGLSFKEKIEIAKLLSRLEVDVIETGFAGESAADAALIRTLGSTLENAEICVPVTPDDGSITRALTALAKVKRPRVNLIAPASHAQMEYVYQIKADSHRAVRRTRVRRIILIIKRAGNPSAVKPFAAALNEICI